MRGLLLVFSLHAGAEPREPDRWFGADKVKHFFSAAFTQSLSYGLLRRAGANQSASLGGASVVTAVVSVAKERHDQRVKGEFSGRDLVWDGAGAGAVSVVLARKDQ